MVSAVTQIPGAMFQTVALTPAVNFSRLEEVFILKQVPDSSRIALERRTIN
jgi:hypothetical protein